ncbi:cold shock domain-containing protein [Pseudomonas tructae]|uniref:Cold shock domain-containing protein n=1 Tax=Pseudomonas tructae TaxID=2518644 RepID=A0A411MHN2_9PSED|nr:cold shock domain-containing protein [Pseudomonas tructae]QBF26345.1 cold shock domain-containing protein [Pseudomonas tructae]
MSRNPRPPVGSTESELSVSTPSWQEQDIFFQIGPSTPGGLILREGQVVSYELVQGPQGQWFAVDIQIIEEPPLN